MRTLARQAGTFASIALVTTSIIAAPLSAHAQTRDDIEHWLAQPAPDPLPAPGTVLGATDLPSIASLVLPGYMQYLDFPQLAMTVAATGDYAPPAVYQQATAAHADKVSLNPAGGMEDYVAGRPFDPERFDAATPEEAGLMIAWNHAHRWQYYGYEAELEMIYLQPTTGSPTANPAAGLEGGGSVERTLTQYFHRVYLSHLAMLPDAGYAVDVGDASPRLYKDYISFTAPFNVKGTTFIVERAVDVNEQDQVSSFLPTERRVRRLSAQERADKFMGSNFTFDDFEAFSGRVMDYEWIYRGTKDILHVIDTREATPRFGGAMSNVPLDEWQVRPCYVVELKPRWTGHMMASKYLFIDQQTFNGLAALVVDREDRLARILFPLYHFPAPDTSTPERALETSVLRWNGALGIDLLGDTTTVTRVTVPTRIPTMTAQAIERKFAVSNLTSGR